MISKTIGEEKGSVFAKEDSCVSYFDHFGKGGKYSFTVPAGKTLTITQIEIWRDGELEKIFEQDSIEGTCPAQQTAKGSSCVTTRAIFSSNSQVTIKNCGSPGFLLFSGFLEDEV